MASFLWLEWYVYVHEVEPQKLQVNFLDIGQGDSILIQTPHQQTFLIDGGPLGGPVLQRIGSVLPFYRTHIDMILATHPDADHIGGLPEVVKKYHPSEIFISGVDANTWTDQRLRKTISDENVLPIRARRGMKINFDVSKTDRSEIIPIMTILFPDRNVDSWINKTNDASIVSRLDFGSTSFMFTGDSPIDVEHFLLNSNLLEHVDVLKVGHHGSRTSTSDEYIKALLPTFAVISVGKNNRYGHPHQETLDVLKENHVKILRTDELGTITMESDSHKIHMK